MKKLIFLFVFIFSLNTFCKAETTHKVLWLGTSISAGCPYPQNACANIGWECYNKSIGASGMIKHNGFLNNGRDGRDLCETIEEKENRYRPYVTNGTLTESQLDEFKFCSFESLVTPYLNGTVASCDIVVIDHGFNDRQYIYDTDKNIIDSYVFDFKKTDSEYDRSTYLGAFSYLVKKIYEINPNVKIVVCSYLENYSEEQPNQYYGKTLCEFLETIAKRLNFPYLNMCDYNNFNYQYVPNTSTYISDYNKTYGTNYVTYNWNGTNPEGNVTTFQYYCPDGVHPHTDKSGRSEKILTDNITLLLTENVLPIVMGINYLSCRKIVSPHLKYDINGRIVDHNDMKGEIYIQDRKKFMFK